MLQGIRDLKAENDSLREQMKSQQAQMRALETELAEAKQILQLVQAQLLSGRRVVETAGGSAR
jgi:chromosome segregation ATPase